MTSMIELRTVATFSSQTADLTVRQSGDGADTNQSSGGFGVQCRSH